MKSSLNENIIELIGHTPILKLNRIAENLQGTIYAKLEFLNPGGSIKWTNPRAPKVRATSKRETRR